MKSANTGYIDGTRANSYYKRSMRIHKESRTEERTERMADLIPFWPRTISYKSLEQLTGLSKESIIVRVSSCHDKFLIFSDDDGSLSRLKNDLSNCI